MKRVLTCTLFFVLSSCSHQSEKWKLRTIGSSGDLVCSQLSLPPDNIYRNLEVFFQKEDQEIKVFLNTYCIPFQKDKEGMISITLSIEGDSNCFKAPVLEGNQRILLPSDANHLLLAALNQKKTVVITTGKYCAEVHHEDFANMFNKFNSP